MAHRPRPSPGLWSDMAFAAARMIIQREGRANRKSTDLSGENEVKLLINEILESIAKLIY